MTATKVASYAAGLATPDLQKLREKHSEILTLLDTVDKLRRSNLDKYVELPQIVVVGDESSGKSSVLSAISRVQFPSRGNVCTRFATELSLRDAEEPQLEARIWPHEEEPIDVKHHLRTFHRVQSEFDALPKLIEDASIHMRIADGGNYYSKSVLSIRISGPGIPNLTLVDLPGLYATGRDDQPIEFAKVVENLAISYMEKENSIILGVVVASHPTKNQPILETIKPFANRALGIVTKADRLDPGGDSEVEIMQLVRNEGPQKMGYGWHVVRNPGEGDALDFKARDEQEKRDLSTIPWTRIPEHQKGIDSLRKRLCDLLLAHVALKLPGVASQIDKLVTEWKLKSSKFPKPRSKPEEHQLYLLQLSNKFVQLARQVTGVSGKDPSFFGALSSDAEQNETMSRRNLRGCVLDMNKDFIDVMALYGAKYFVQWRNEADYPHWIRSARDRDPSFLVERYNVSNPIFISEDGFKSRVESLALMRRGNELPGIADPTLAMEVFRDQSSPWEDIASRHVELVMEKAQSVVEEILKHVTEHDKATRQRIKDEFLESFFEKRRIELLDKVQELLPAHHESCYPAPLEYFFRLDMQQLVSGRVQMPSAGVKQSKSVDETLQLPPGMDSTGNVGSLGYAASGHTAGWRSADIVDYALQYYDTTLLTFMNNVMMLAVERQLMVKIPDLFSMEKITEKLTTQQQQDLVAESPEILAERLKLDQGLADLENGKALCKRWRSENELPEDLAKIQGFLSSVQTSRSMAGNGPDLATKSAAIHLMENKFSTRVDVRLDEEEL